MKKNMFVFFVFFLLPCLWSVGGGLTFETFQEVITKSQHEGFTLNTGKTQGSKFSFVVTYDGAKSEYESLTFRLFLGTDNFSAVNLAMKPKRIKIQQREAIFIDGASTGLSTISVLLKNKSGRFTVSHRMIGGIPMNISKLEALISKIELEKLEK